MTTNIYDMADTWDNGATVFTSIKMTITDTASDSASMLLEFIRNSSTEFSINKFGQVVSDNITAAGGALLDSEGVTVKSTGGLHWSQSSGLNDTLDLHLYRDAAGVLAQRNSTNAQITRGYRTFTDTSNYERWALQSGAGFFEWAAETAGTGTDNIDLRITPAGTGVIDVRNLQVSATSSNTATLNNAIASASPALWINVKASGSNYVIPVWTTI